MFSYGSSREKFGKFADDANSGAAEANANNIYIVHKPNQEKLKKKTTLDNERQKQHTQAMNKDKLCFRCGDHTHLSKKVRTKMLNARNVEKRSISKKFVLNKKETKNVNEH